MTGSLISALLGYLLGSIPTGYILVKMLIGEDIRSFGSGNIGATNVGRVLGKKWAVFTAMFDMSKGWLAIVITMLFISSDHASLALAGTAAVIGHDFPVWLRFNGGKGVATSFGSIAFFDFFDPLPAIAGGLIWFAIREKTRCVSIASIISLFSTTFFFFAVGADRAYIISAASLALLTTYRHKSNIQRVLAGTENKVEPIWPLAAKELQRVIDKMLSGGRR